MSSWRGPTAPILQQQQELQEQNNGPRAKCDQVVFEAIAKAAEIVVGSRCWIENVPGSNSSSRFNLLVPEVQGVRSILNRWKRALHVPLRLDVFYQHDDGRRELLERWCLEYAPKTTYSFQHTSADPIVQLRQVCKSIVVWLRTLYGWSRMLPAQALRQRHSLGSDNHVGFSIYVVSEGNDDVTGLITNQGFLSQGQPHSVLTPYGELGWKVFYAPESMVRQLVPEVPKYSIQQPIPIPTTTASLSSAVSQPIPMQQLNTAQTSNHQYPMSPQPLEAARSAPTQPRSPGYYRSNSADVPGSLPKRATVFSNIMRRNSDMPILQQTDMPQQQPQQQQQRYSFQANIGGGGHLLQPSSSISKSNNPPTKNLSALSLAMLHDDSANVNGESREAAEKRRAALHHAPPQFSTPQQQRPTPSSPVLKPSNLLATAGEYGYGYNNQLPNIIIKATGPRPSSPATARGSSFDGGRASPGPLVGGTPLSSTPTGGFLLGTATPTPPSAVPMTLIPPRSSVTPPFVRPAGFVTDPPPSQPLPPSVAAFGDVKKGQQQQQQHSMNHQTSLDLLASSPFHRPNHMMAHMLDDEFKNFNLNDLMPPDIAGTGFMNSRTRPEDFYYDNAFGQSPGDEDDMPFAVDCYSPSAANNGNQAEKRSNTTTTNNNGVSSSSVATSNLLLSSANGMASFCSAPPRRLALFDSVATVPPPSGSQTDNKPLGAQDDMMSSLANELAEFKTFGASLMMDGKASQSSSSSTPISLRP